jgi:AcrR family transcriptional regulator
MPDFQRARTEEQRAARERAILSATRAMLVEMPVAAVTLTEISRRVGLAKSNVLRYFDSREAVLLDLLTQDSRDLLAHFATHPVQVDPSWGFDDRSAVLAESLAREFARRPTLCDLLSAQSSVLEFNVSGDVAVRFKRGARDALHGLASLVESVLPEFANGRSLKTASAVILLVGALWTRSNPAPATRYAFDSDPSLRFMDVEFESELIAAIEIQLLGLSSYVAARPSAG